ncbi:MAG: YbaN family protein [Paracoccus sp. (in: a-proteobacteria)]|nr:YbaN family protein [Paracoccus sp. (in: a-proteobacteria)]
MRLVYLGIGWAAVGLALIGTFLPIMPTVPFLLIAIWAFGRSSERLRQKLLNDPVFGPDIRRWHERGAIRRSAKVLAISAMSASIVISWAVGLPPVALAGQTAILAAVAVYIATRPER